MIIQTLWNNILLTDIRKRLTTEYYEQWMKISIEGSSNLDNDVKDLMIYYWESKKLRKISV
jgi:hypothetical protein